MSFSSSQVTMKKLLLRRNTPSAADIQLGQDDKHSDLLRNSSIPLVDQEQTIMPTPSHKRKQSDAIVLSDLDISAVVVKSTYSSLSPIEQGTVADAEDDDACYDSRSQRWTNPLSLLSSCQFLGLFMMLAVLTTLQSVRSRRIKHSIGDPYALDLDFYEGSDEIGEPLEAKAPDENWIELFDNPERMPTLKSAGPWPMDPGGLYMFENVCVTNNIDAPKPPNLDTSLRGLLYFSKDKALTKNPKRCVPCSKKAVDNQVEDDRWDATSNSDSDLGHHCGMKGLHAMFAKSVGDYNECMADTENHKSMIRTKQNQSPSDVKQIHFFQEPTLLLQFDANNRENSLFDMLLTYLPHWHKFRKHWDFPFQNVISHSVEGCLSHSRNWFCEVTHQMGAFSYARELPWEKDSTLYCFKNLYYNQLEYQRDFKHEGLVTKAIMDDFRDELFHNFALPGPRDMSEVREKDAKIGMKRPLNIALYANGKDGWDGLEKLVRLTKSMKQYHGVEFNLIENFDVLTVAEQANAFNIADAVLMANGDHMANAIFSPDYTFFAEVGCFSKTLIGNDHFMSLILGTHRSVTKCEEAHSADEICVECFEDNSFWMTEEAFRALIDDVMKHHEKKISLQRDSR